MCFITLFITTSIQKNVVPFNTTLCKNCPYSELFCSECVKIWTRKTLNTDTFQALLGSNIHRTWLECVKTNYMRIKKISNGQTIQKIPNNREGLQQTFLLVKTCWRRIEILSVTKDKCFVISLNIGYVLHHCNAKGSLYICIEFWMRAPNRRQNLGNLLWLASVSNNNRNVIAATQNSRCYSSSRLLLLFLLF